MKFRIWNTEEHQFVDSKDNWFLNTDGEVEFLDEFGYLHQAKNCVVSRSCDISDSFDEPIYYGDIIKATTHYSGEYYYATFTINNLYDEQRLVDYLNNGDKVEVVGNIYE